MYRGNSISESIVHLVISLEGLPSSYFDKLLILRLIKSNIKFAYSKKMGENKTIKAST